MSETRLSFKEMCAKFDVTPRTLRYYEYIELLSPEREGRARYYTSRDIARMELIMRARRFEFSLEEARQWLLMYDEQGTEEQMRIFVEMAGRQLGALQEKKNQIQAAMDELEALRKQTAEMLDG
ncbi:MAG: MerR family DNA-binding transcriptional regulator [Marinovum sp.]|nr:MerR family DNA-binding transcriptional regulator [Marinovum sp.]